jgi:hypothetical protein
VICFTAWSTTHKLTSCPPQNHGLLLPRLEDANPVPPHVEHARLGCKWKSAQGVKERYQTKGVIRKTLVRMMRMTRKARRALRAILTKMRKRAKKVVRGAPERRHLDQKPRIRGLRLALRHAGLPDGVNIADLSISGLDFDTCGVWGWRSLLF